MLTIRSDPASPVLGVHAPTFAERQTLVVCPADRKNKLWQYGNMAIWQYGYRAIWQYGNMAIGL